MGIRKGGGEGTSEGVAMGVGGGSQRSAGEERLKNNVDQMTLLLIMVEAENHQVRRKILFYPRAPKHFKLVD